MKKEKSYGQKYSKRFGYTFSIVFIILGLIIFIGSVPLGIALIVIGILVLFWHKNRIKKRNNQ